MRMTVPDSLVTFDPDNNQITLASPFDQITEEHILKIRDDTTAEVLYDRGNPRNTVSVSAGVITYGYDNAHQAGTDDLQVELEFGYYSPEVVVFSAQALTASGSATSESKVYLAGASTIWLAGIYTGDASSVTIVVSGHIDDDDTGDAIATMTVDSSLKHAKIQVPPGLAYASMEITNNDGVNTCAVTGALIPTW